MAALALTVPGQRGRLCGPTFCRRRRRRFSARSPPLACLLASARLAPPSGTGSRRAWRPLARSLLISHLAAAQDDKQQQRRRHRQAALKMLRGGQGNSWRRANFHSLRSSAGPQIAAPQPTEAAPLLTYFLPAELGRPACRRPRLGRVGARAAGSSAGYLRGAPVQLSS